MSINAHDLKFSQDALNRELLTMDLSGALRAMRVIVDLYALDALVGAKPFMSGDSVPVMRASDAGAFVSRGIYELLEENIKKQKEVING